MQFMEQFVEHIQCMYLCSNHKMSSSIYRKVNLRKMIIGTTVAKQRKEITTVYDMKAAFV